MSATVPPPPIWAAPDSPVWSLWYQQLADYMSNIVTGKTDLQLPQSTANTAPLNFGDSAVLKTTPALGDMEYKDPYLYFTTSQGRGVFLFSHALNPVSTVSLTVAPLSYTNSNTYTESVIISAIAGGTLTWSLVRGGNTTALPGPPAAKDSIDLSPGDEISFGGASSATLILIPR